jgi:ABC-type multidrug transport system fused ATPase/permease subunit
VVFTDVSFQYPGTDKPVLSHINCSVQEGTCIAFIGGSGEGKTTLLDLTTGLLLPTSGSIHIDSLSIEAVDLEFWRSKIGLVQQGAPLFHGTILENIAWGAPGTPDPAKAERCARLANAWDFIERLPNRLDAAVEEKGSTLSGGQRQRLALARALYNDPWLLILDEPTSELDYESEERILKALQGIKASYAILIASHRPKMLELSDEVLLLQKGTIEERGTYQELKRRTGSMLQRLSSKESL